MIAAHSYETVCNDLANAFRQRYAGTDAVRLVGFLFARPTSQLAKEQIVPNLDYFHHRSANHVDFFCAGYGMYWEIFRSSVPDMEVVVARVGDNPWLFSAMLFDQFRQEIEQEAEGWTYGGGTELILANAHYDSSSESATVDFRQAIVIDLDAAIQENAITNVDHLFEEIVRYTEGQQGDDPTWGFSDRMGLNSVRRALKELLLSILPQAVRTDGRTAFYFYVRDLTPTP
jgi:hypothetical protein